MSGGIKIEDGRIRAVTAFALEPGADPSSTWVEIGIRSEGETLQHRIAILDAGYVGASSPVGAVVEVNMRPTYELYCDVYSEDSTLVRCAIIKESD